MSLLPRKEYTSLSRSSRTMHRLSDAEDTGWKKKQCYAKLALSATSLDFHEPSNF